MPRQAWATLVSIRAPARGATSGLSSQCFPAAVSIRAPARGATLLPAAPVIVAAGFNSRSREGSDGAAQVFEIAEVVSIRAPARGATLLFLFELKVIWVSIRAPARGATNLGRRIIPRTSFQFALPRGERRGRHPGCSKY